MREKLVTAILQVIRSQGDCCSRECIRPNDKLPADALPHMAPNGPTGGPVRRPLVTVQRMCRASADTGGRFGSFTRSRSDGDGCHGRRCSLPKLLSGCRESAKPPVRKECLSSSQPEDPEPCDFLGVLVAVVGDYVMLKRSCTVEFVGRRKKMRGDPAASCGTIRSVARHMMS